LVILKKFNKSIVFKQCFFIFKNYIKWIYLLTLIAGFGGGVIQGLVGFVEHQCSYKNYKNVPFKLPYFAAMMFISGVIGLLTAVAIKELGLFFRLGLPYSGFGFCDWLCGR